MWSYLLRNYFLVFDLWNFDKFSSFFYIIVYILKTIAFFRNIFTQIDRYSSTLEDAYTYFSVFYEKPVFFFLTYNFKKFVKIIKYYPI